MSEGGAGASKVEHELDRLYGIPLEEFVAARNELARRLKQTDDAPAADLVKQLTKPSVAAWTINQLSRQHKTSMKGLLDAAASLRKTQEQAVKRGGSGEAMRSAQAEERQAIRELTHQAERILENAGRAPSTSVLNQISSTLRAAAVNEDGRTALKAGRLSGEVKSAGFDALAGLDVHVRRSPRAPAPPDELADRRRQKKEREQRLRDLKARVRKLATLAEQKERQAEHAEKAAADARAAAEESRRQAEEAAIELENFDQ